MFCLGGDAWESYINEATGNKGSNQPAETWALLEDVGPTTLRIRCWLNGGEGRLAVPDLERLRLTGQRDLVLLTVMPGTPEDRKPLQSVDAWLAAYPPQVRFFGERGLEPVIEPKNENIDHTDSPEAQAKWFLSLLDRTDLPLLAPSYAPGNAEVEPYIRAMEPAYRHPKTAGIALHIREGNLGDVERFKVYGKPLHITEFAEERLDPALRPDYIRKNVEKWILDPLVGGVMWFSLRTKDERWRRYWPTADEKVLWRSLAATWRRLRRYPLAVASPPPATGGAFDEEHLRVARSLAERIRKRVETASAAIGGIDSDAQEALDRLVMAGLK